MEAGVSSAKMGEATDFEVFSRGQGRPRLVCRGHRYLVEERPAQGMASLAWSRDSHTDEVRRTRRGTMVPSSGPSIEVR